MAVPQDAESELFGASPHAMVELANHSAKEVLTDAAGALA